jgi:NAD+ synthase
MKSMLEPSLPTYARTAIEEFIKGHVETARASGVVVGLSGGIDSALVAKLSVEALGPDHVRGFSLPDANSPASMRKEVSDYAKDLGISFREVLIGPIEAAVIEALGERSADNVMKGNIKARIRMMILYAEAGKSKSLVAGTGNKSEILLGYFTKYGDGGVDILPIGDLYKTSVWALGREVGLPESVILRPPTAGLWEGQTDEGDLGFSYEFADKVLVGLERLLEPEEIAERLGVTLDKVAAVVSRVKTNRHKRRPAPIPKISSRTVGLDWRD